MPQTINHYAQRLLPLVGSKITAIVTDPAEYHTDDYIGLVLDGKKVLWLLSDPEGNGPGGYQLDKLGKE